MCTLGATYLLTYTHTSRAVEKQKTYVDITKRKKSPDINDFGVQGKT
jgi:hypothetical protein